MAFDGWRGAFDYWTRYDSRDIFPAGWCARSRHPVQPPGSRQSKIDATNKRRSNKPSNTFIPDLVALPAAPNPAPVTIHFHSGCRTGPFVNGSRMHATTTAPNHKTLAKLCLQEMLASSGDAAQLARRLFDVAGESSVVAVAGKNFIVKIPEKGVGPAEMAAFLASVCEACDACPNLITLAAGPDQCDKCIKPDPGTPEDKRPADVTASNDAAPAADATAPERQNGREKANGSAQLKNVAVPKRRSDADAKQKSVQPAQSSKRRRSSDADTESSTSMSSTASSASEHFAKVPKKEVENSVSVSTETKTLQKQTITTTSISSEWRRVGHACRDIVSNLRLPSISVTNSRPSTIAKKEKTPSPPPPPAPAPPTSSRSQMPRGPVTDWSIEDVIQFIAYTDPSLGAHATVFREHVSVGFHWRCALPR